MRRLYVKDSRPNKVLINAIKSHRRKFILEHKIEPEYSKDGLEHILCRGPPFLRRGAKPERFLHEFEIGQIASKGKLIIEDDEIKMEINTNNKIVSYFPHLHEDEVIETECNFSIYPNISDYYLGTYGEFSALSQALSPMVTFPFNEFLEALRIKPKKIEDDILKEKTKDVAEYALEIVRQSYMNKYMPCFLRPKIEVKRHDGT